MSSVEAKNASVIMYSFAAVVARGVPAPIPKAEEFLPFWKFTNAGNGIPPTE
jgi:hypothetical protein